MKTEEEIKKQIKEIQNGKSMAKTNDDITSYKAWVKAERWLKWVIEEEKSK